MTVSGAKPCRTIQEIDGRINDLNMGESNTEALDQLENLFEVILPELQDPAEDLISQFHTRYRQLTVEQICTRGPGQWACD